MTTYSSASRLLHWVVALCVIGLVPVGFYMVSRGAATNFDALTNTLYSWHKAIGFTVLMLMVLRIAAKIRGGTPPYPASLPRWQVGVAHAVHGAIYILLFAVPLSGWAGVTAYPALVTVGGYNLPPMPFVPQNADTAAAIFRVHGALAIALVALVAMHLGAALKHLIIDRDGVFQRMWFAR